MTVTKEMIEAAKAETAEEVLGLLTAHELYQYRPKAFQGFIDYVRKHFAAASLSRSAEAGKPVVACYQRRPEHEHRSATVSGTPWTECPTDEATDTSKQWTGFEYRALYAAPVADIGPVSVPEGWVQKRKAVIERDGHEITDMTNGSWRLAAAGWCTYQWFTSLEDAIAAAPQPTKREPVSVPADLLSLIPEKIDVPPLSERGVVGQVLDVAWPLCGGNHQDADFWNVFSFAAHLALKVAAAPQPNPSKVDADIRAIIADLRNEDDTDAPVHSERKAGWHAALDAFVAAITTIKTAQGAEINAEREFLANEARRYATHYPEASDGRNTFIIFAEMIERRSSLAAQGEKQP